MRAATIAALAALLAASVLHSAQAQDNNEIVVTAPAQSDAQRVRSYVGSLTIPGRRAALPRWGREICPGVAGMDNQHAQAMNDRVARIALDLGLEVGAPGCTANILVYFTRDSDTVAANFASGRSGMVSTATGTRDAVRDFVETPRAVRWWHLAVTSADGFEVERDSQEGINTLRPQEALDPNAGGLLTDTGGIRTAADAARTQQSAQEVTNATRVRGASRLRGNTNENIARVLIIIDADRVRTQRFGALADYVAMVGLAQINPDVDVGVAPSILSLFSDRPGPKPDRVTSWDMAYLAGLYRSPEDTRDARQQESYIFQNMMESDRH
jgi:hypothetical protein